MGQPLSDEVEQFLRSLNSTDQEEATDRQEPQETIHVYFVREEPEPEPDVVDATPIQSTQGPSAVFTMVTVFFCVGVLLSSILFQLYLVANPPIATIAIVPNTRTVTFSSMLLLGRLLPPIRLYQSQTVPTTGRGHQDARAATGTVTFYNAAFSAQTVPAGSVFVGSDGTEIQTDETISVAANSPPQDGIASAAAHAVTPGSHGNIQALDINGTVSSSLFAKNLDAFSGGQDARDFPIVTHRDINTTAAPMKPILAHSMTGALQGELRAGEGLLALPCSLTVESNHQVGDEASKVTVVVTESCTAIAYDDQALRTRAAQLLTSKAAKNLGAGYSRIGSLQVSVKGATITGATPNLAFSSVGTWAFGLSGTAQERLKHIIAGRVPQDAVRLLRAQAGIQNASLQWDEQTKLPKDSKFIHFVFVIPTA